MSRFSRFSRWTKAVRVLCVSALAVCAALFAPQADAPAQDCETGGARVTFDPVSSLVYSPDDGPIEVTAVNGGPVKVRQLPAPSTFTVTTSGFQRNAVAARFRFDRNVTATLVVERTAGAAGLNWIAIERDSTTCAFPIDSVFHDLDPPGTYEVDGAGINAHPLEIRFPTSVGNTTMEITAPFQKDVVYRVVFYVQTSGLSTNAAVTWRAFTGPRLPDPESALKILPPGADPLTGCPGTDVSNLTAAYRAEQAALAHIAVLESVYTRAFAGAYSEKEVAKIKCTPRDMEIVRSFITLSVMHLECAKELVQGRDDLDPANVQRAVTAIDNALTLDDAALTELDTELPGIGTTRDRQLLARLGQVTATLTSALSRKNVAGTEIGSGWQVPVLDPAFTVGAVLRDAANLTAARDMTIETALATYRDKLEELRDVVRADGTQGLDRVIASNQKARCREFLEAAIIGELNEIAVAYEQQRREQQIAILAGTMPAPDPAVVKGTKAILGTVVQQGTQVSDGVKALAKPLRVPDGGVSKKKADKAFDAIVRKVGKKADPTTEGGPLSKRRKNNADLLALTVP